MFDTKTFGLHMQAKRKAANLTQQQLADKIGLTRQAISKYETGESFPDISIVIRLAPGCLGQNPCLRHCKIRRRL